MFIFKKKDDNIYECSFYNFEFINFVLDIEFKILMIGYFIINKNMLIFNEFGVYFELIK